MGDIPVEEFSTVTGKPTSVQMPWPEEEHGFLRTLLSFWIPLWMYPCCLVQMQQGLCMITMFQLLILLFSFYEIPSYKKKRVQFSKEERTKNCFSQFLTKGKERNQEERDKKTKRLSVSKVKIQTLSITLSLSLSLIVIISIYGSQRQRRSFDIYKPIIISSLITVSDPFNAEFGFSRPNFRASQLAGSVKFYQRHVFLCYKNPQVWPSKIEASEFDQVPRLLSIAVMASKADMNKEVCVYHHDFWFHSSES